MKTFGAILLAGGLLLGGFALNMDVSVQVPARDFGYGIRTPAMAVANVDRMAQRQNFLIFGGVLAVAGAILIGFSSSRPASPPPATNAEASGLLDFLEEAPAAPAPSKPGSMRGTAR
ncbi:hypothetical protein [Massilia sp.]|uniref:hypothetical protein n=1 Tax=Massilia sp. TaxID=1882437 RepID=UPI0028A00AAF|nr:hypothetical protein [Massilia sp.]